VRKDIKDFQMDIKNFNRDFKDSQMDIKNFNRDFKDFDTDLLATTQSKKTDWVDQYQFKCYLRMCQLYYTIN
jgi:hypothetical protein